MTAWKRFALLAFELLLVTCGALAGAKLASETRIIPKALLKLPEISFSAADTRTVVLSIFVSVLITLLAGRFLFGWAPFSAARRFAIEIYTLVTGIVAASLYLFMLTGVNFSPEFLLQATLISIFLFLLTFAVVRAAQGASPLGEAGRGLAALVVLLKSPLAWLVILFALTPLVVAILFTTDRDFAAWVTNLRVAVNSESDLPYEVANALGDTLFETPIMAQFADGDPNTIYVLERNGRLYRADYPSGGNKALLLDIRQSVGTVEAENGALGFDLHPQFGRGGPNDGSVYVYYTEYRADGQTNRLERFSLASGSVEANVATRQVLFAQNRNNDGYHNAGSVEFGPDGFLYVSVGEGSAVDCHQRIDCGLFGGILRLDVDQQGGDISRPILVQPQDGQTSNYYIPLDNPFVERPGALGEFWALGLRNPFRIAFDPETGALWAGEVGSTVWEEANLIEKGGNYQFPYVEGYEEQRFQKPADLVGEEKPPVYTYRHTAFLRSIIGGVPYRGDAVPEADGRYVFMDNYSGEVFVMPLDQSRVNEVTTIARTADVAQRGPTGMVVAPDGALLLTIMGDNDQPTGMVARLVASDSEAGREVREDAEEQRLAAAEQLRSGELPEPVSAAAAASLWSVNCARCHGSEGRGNGPDQELLEVHIPDFTRPEFQRWRSDEAIMQVLRGGGEAVGQSGLMPPWEGVLTPNEMAGLVNHVRSFGDSGE